MPPQEDEATTGGRSHNGRTKPPRGDEATTGGRSHHGRTNPHGRTNHTGGRSHHGRTKPPREDEATTGGRSRHEGTCALSRAGAAPRPRCASSARRRFSPTNRAVSPVRHSIGHMPRRAPSPCASAHFRAPPSTASGQDHFSSREATRREARRSVGEAKCGEAARHLPTPPAETCAQSSFAPPGAGEDSWPKRRFGRRARGQSTYARALIEHMSPPPPPRCCRARQTECRGRLVRSST